MSVNANFDSNTTSIKLYVLFIQRTKNTNIYVKLNRLIASNAIFIFELQYRRMTKNTKKKTKRNIICCTEPASIWLQVIVLFVSPW